METTTARRSRCTYFKRCGNEAPSDSPYLAFFKDKSQPQPECAAPGTNARGQCGYHEVAHDLFDGKPGSTGVNKGRWPRNLEPHAFVPQTEGEPFDEHYCGCFGWD